MKNRGKILACLLVLGAIDLPRPELYAHEWTRHGSNQRSGYTDARVPPNPVLLWTYKETHPPRHAWKEPNRELQYIDFDYATQVAVTKGLMIFGSSADHSVRALELNTGDERWHFYTEGPVRFAPTVDGDRAYVASDDGHLYALDAATGELQWKFRGGPGEDRLIGNEQMISHWPARSGVLAAEGKLYFTAGMWSRDGVFIYCLNAADGSVIWRNDTAGFYFTSLPHSSGLAGVAPQGYLVLHRGMLYVPTGRGAPACFDASTGELVFYENGQGYKPHQEGGSRVMAWQDWVIFKRRAQHTEENVRYEPRLAGPGGASGLYALDYRTGEPQWALTDKHLAAAHGDTLILAGQGPVIRVSAQELIQGYSQYWRNGQKVKDDPNIQPHGLSYAWADAKTPPFPVWMSPLPYAKWQADVGYVFTVLLAGDTVLAGGRGRVSAIDANRGEVLWQHPIEGDARGLCVAGDRVIVSSTAGKLYVFGDASTGVDAAPRLVARTIKPMDASGEVQRRAQAVLEASGQRAGYALVLGAGEEGQLLSELARQSELTVYCLESDEARANRIRQRLDDAGLLGARVAIHVGSFDPLPYNPYWANLIVWGEACGSSAAQVNAAELYRVLRPYGGIAVQLAGDDSAEDTRHWLTRAGVPESEIADCSLGLIIRRGPLQGAGEWTHAYANIGRTGSSEDRLAKLPLGMLWWGGPGPARTVSRHWRAPVPLFSNGILFVQGQHDVFAVDAYNGREMWNRHLPGVGRMPPANRGGNIVADKDSVYCIQERACLRLDAHTGETRAVYEFPLDARHRQAVEELAANYENDVKTRIVWEYLGVCGDVILGTLGNEQIYDVNPSQPYYDCVHQARYLFAFSKSSGQLLWERKMERAVSPMAIVADPQYVYYLDRTDEHLYKQKARRGDVEFASVLKAVRLDTGESVWESDSVPMERKSLILKDDVLVAYPNPIEHNTQQGDSGVAAYSAADGHLLWEETRLDGVSGGGRGAVIRHTFVIGDTLYLPWARDLHTGKERLPHRNPLTGEAEPFNVEGQNFCGTISSGRNLLCYRSASIGFQEIARDSGSYWLPELRPSCWISVIPAGGLVLAPEGYGTCICPYNYKTSAALIPVERHEDWSVYLSGNKYALQQRRKRKRQETTPVFQDLYLNLNAPGDHIDAAGNVWMAWPRPMARERRERYLDTPLPVTVTGVQEHFRVNADFHTIRGTDRPWLFCSGLEGPLEIRIPLPERAPESYRIEFDFAETEAIQPGSRVFDILVQGKTVLRHVDIAKQAGGSNRAWTATIDELKARGELTIELVPGSGRLPRLCALSIHSES